MDSNHPTVVKRRREMAANRRIYRTQEKVRQFLASQAAYTAEYNAEIEAMKAKFPASKFVGYIGIEYTSEAGAYLVVIFTNGDEIRIGNQEGESLDHKFDAEYTGEFMGGYICQGDPHGATYTNTSPAELARRAYVMAWD